MVRDRRRRRAGMKSFFFVWESTSGYEQDHIKIEAENVEVAIDIFKTRAGDGEGGGVEWADVYECERVARLKAGLVRVENHEDDPTT